MSITVLLFASAAEAVDKSSIDISIPSPFDTNKLKGLLISLHPNLEPLFSDSNEDSLTLALNEEYVLPGEVKEVRDGDEVALIPPISGG